METNFVVADNKIYILSHVPLFRNAGLIDLHKVISTPILLTNSTRQIVIKPPQTIVGLSPDRSRFVSMTESDLLGCKHLHNEFWCIDNQIAKKISHNSCVKSLFEKNLKDILEQCPITTVTPQEYLYQLNSTTFYGFSPMSQNVHITCQVFDDRTGLISHKLSEKTIKGFSSFKCNQRVPEQ